jgi:uncharacterized membrane protein YjgN (DUF898 family)
MDEMDDLTQVPPPEPPPARPALRDPPPVTPGYGGTFGNVAGIALANGLLSILTLGFYRFWGKTRLRRYLWGHVSFREDDLEYSGRGMELMVGFLIAIAVLVPLGAVVGLLDVALADEAVALSLKNLVQTLAILFLIQIAIYRARRYRLTRTQWRGIRGGQSGSSLRYAVLALGWGLLATLTVTLTYPVMRNRLQRYRMENTWFGDRSFEFGAWASEMFWPWVVALLLFIPTLGLSYIWYRVKEFRYFAERTRYGRLGFRSDLATGRVIWIASCYLAAVIAILFVLGGLATLLVPGMFAAVQALGSGDEVMIAEMTPLMTLAPFGLMIVILVALGVARMAVFVHPMLRAICGSLAVIGEEDFEAILQSQQAMPGRGEGFADAFDVGSI